MPPKRRKPGAQCLCRAPDHRHIGQCQNKVWGYGRQGHLYKLCDECRVSMTGGDVPRQEPRPMTPEPQRPASELPADRTRAVRPYRDPLLSDPIWREPF